ncbi:MAG: hypothetical protein LJE84_07235 [Gammaproteobacteria bacterium]|nr:hypothetical protein [Gammaproteobacteria bacterium]
MATPSINRHLLRSLCFGLGLLILAVGLLAEYLLRTRLQDDFDAILLARAQSLVSLTEQSVEGAIEFEFVPSMMPEFAALEEPEYFELHHHNGGLLAQSPSLGKTAAILASPGNASEIRFRNLSLPDGRNGRAVDLPFPARQEIPDPEDNVKPQPIRAPEWLQATVARSREQLDTEILFVRLAVGGYLLLTLLGAGAIALFSVRRGLAPLRAIGHEVRRLDADTLTHRLSGDVPSELAPITRQVNALLERLESAFAREKRFSGDVAHELRTPLAELRTLAEVGRRWPDDQEMVSRFFDDLVDITEDMSQIVTNLLTLARCDAGHLEVAESDIDLNRCINLVWERLRPTADARKLSLEADLNGLARVRSDARGLELILSNILSNAVAYANDGSIIQLEVRADSEGTSLSVSNATDKVDEQDLNHLFDRFWRKDPDRSGSGHAGLGLALVKALADRLGLRVGARLDPNHRFRITLGGLRVA